MKKVIFKSLFTSILLVLGLSVGVKQTTHEVVEAATIDVLTIAPSDFNGESYVANNGEHQKLTDGGINVSYYTNQVMLMSGVIQAQKSKGLIYNTTALEYISKIVLEGTTNGFSVYVGTEINQQAKELTSIDEKTYEVLEGNYSYFTLVNGNVTTKLTSIEVHFQKFDQDYTATLHYNDGITENGSITSVEGKFTAPETPTRTGYVFDGWYTDDETFENLFDFENTFATENIHLYAKWVDEKDTYLQTTSFALGFDYVIENSDEFLMSATYDNVTYYATNVLNKNRLKATTDKTLAAKFVTEVISAEQSNIVRIKDVETNKYLVENSSGIDLADSDQNGFDLTTFAYNGSTSGKFLRYNNQGSYFGMYLESLNTSASATLVYDSSYSFSNYALRFGTEITTENYAKLGEVKSYGVLVAPTASLEGSTFKEWYELSDGLEDLVNTLDVLNINNAEMQTTETGYSFGGLLQNIPETQIHTSVSAACYVVNKAGEVFFAEQKDMSIVGAATYYAEHAAELGLNETETTLVNVLKGM